MNINDLWVGDFLKVKSNGLIGRFEALENKMVLINIAGDIHKVSVNDVELSEDPIISSSHDIFEADDSKPTLGFKGNSIDLHIEVLNPHMQDALPERIRDYQIEQCKLFLSYAIAKRYASIEIIHGKGTGLLKKEIHHIVKMEPAAKFFLEKNQGGSTEVWLTPF